MPDTTLLLLLDEVRGKTLRVLKTVPPAQARWAPAGLQNTISWHAGHAYVTVESLTSRALGRPPEMPAGWPEIFGMNSRPAEVAANLWLGLDEVVAQLEAQHQRLRTIIAGLSPEQLEAPAAALPDRTVRFGILHGLHDEACHCGEIHLLRKMQDASAPKI